MKKFIAILLSLVVIISFGILPVKGGAKYFKKNGFVYTLNGNEAQICFYCGKAENVKYPSQLDGHKVTKIGCDYDANSSGLKPNKKLKSVTVPDSVRELEVRCFDGFKKLKRVTLGNSLTGIPEFCFSNCKALQSVTIPSGVKRICWGAFLNCSGLEKVILPDSLRVIEYCSFCRTGLKSVTIPKNVKQLGNTAFNAPGVFEASPLTEVKVVKGNRIFRSENGVLYNKRKTALCLYPKNKSGAKLFIPDSVTRICPEAFSSSKNLTEIVFGKNVRTIGSRSFYSCKKLEKLSFKTNKLTNIGSNAFGCCKKLKRVNLPDSTRVIHSCAFLRCESLVSFTCGKELEIIGAAAFCDCEKLTSVKVNSTAELDIRSEAFLGCNKMKSITIPGNVKKIGSRAIGYFHNILTDSDEEDPDIVRIGKIKGFIIKGAEGTAAEKYADRFGFKFKRF